MEPSRPELYPPWKPPFQYNRDGSWIEDRDGHRVLDLRGWGYLTGKGCGALGMPENSAATIQDEIGKRVAELMNADAAPWKEHADPIRRFLAAHQSLLDQGNEYAYFELAYTRTTGWMAWLCTDAKELNPRRIVLAQGQGGAPDEACTDALAQLTPEQRSKRRLHHVKFPILPSMH